MTFGDNETVTISLKRYEELKEEISQLEEELDEINNLFLVTRFNENKRITVTVDRQKLEEYLTKEHEWINIFTKCPVDVIYK